MEARSGYARRKPRVPAPALLAAALALLSAATAISVRHGLLRFGPTATLPVAQAPGEPEPALLYLGQTSDCVAFGRSLRALGELALAGEFRLLVVLTDPLPSGEVRERLEAGLGSGATLRSDLGAAAVRLARRLGQRRTPVAILVDARGRPLLVLPPERLGAPIARLLASVRAALATSPPAPVPTPPRTPRTS